jgi:hypothetical protein
MVRLGLAPTLAGTAERSETTIVERAMALADDNGPGA